MVARISLPPPAVSAAVPVTELHALRDELVELAYGLDRRGRPEAADVAMTLAARLAELCAEAAGPATTASG